MMGEPPWPVQQHRTRKQLELHSRVVCYDISNVLFCACGSFRVDIAEGISPAVVTLFRKHCQSFVHLTLCLEEQVYPGPPPLHSRYRSLKALEVIRRCRPPCVVFPDAAVMYATHVVDFLLDRLPTAAPPPSGVGDPSAFPCTPSAVLPPLPDQ
jgi:hypothetical protein